MGQPASPQNLQQLIGRWCKACHLAGSAASPRIRLVVWLLLFLTAYRLGLPVLYSAALAALPWLLLPADRGQ
ncbi:MAG TPA: hypothetical protein HPQ04_14750 [Rhodospirillaceae bacterium]|nr:hypothetical protein [Rhodospirillaceae bacterium]